ncbi:MAG: hypothetical protein N2A40_05065 [Desulfobulbaceae bacterium]
MKNFFLLLLILLLTTACSGEGGDAGNTYGSGIDPQAPIIKVKDAYLDKSLQGKVVSLEGTILSQCGSPDKCWYFMEDETGRMFVNLKPANFTLPAAIGKKAKVTGTIQQAKDGYQIIAQGAEVL